MPATDTISHLSSRIPVPFQLFNLLNELIFTKKNNDLGLSSVTVVVVVVASNWLSLYLSVVGSVVSSESERQLGIS